MRRLLLTLALVALTACAPPPPAPTAAPTLPPPPPSAPAPEQATGTVRVTASALNVRERADADADVVAQVKKGTELAVLRREGGWVNVRMGDGRVGWVAERFVSDGANARVGGGGTKTARKKTGCDSDYAFEKAPTPSFSEDGAHGLVIVEANVNTKGVVTSTKVVSNGTGDEALGFLAEREIKSAKFTPPMRNCVARAFIFTYRRTF